MGGQRRRRERGGGGGSGGGGWHPLHHSLPSGRGRVGGRICKRLPRRRRQGSGCSRRGGGVAIARPRLLQPALCLLRVPP